MRNAEADQIKERGGRLYREYIPGPDPLSKTELTGPELKALFADFNVNDNGAFNEHNEAANFRGVVVK